ncbi:MAG: serine/threonine protein kinase [bacterium]|nr:serine/threonine protein kinase [bacterium]
MNPERWQQIKTILDEVLDLPPAQRRAFLDRACEEDPSLRQEVGAYIELDQGLGDFMPEPAAPVDQESPEDTAADLRIGPYRTLRRIGEGGMGTVYLAVREDDFEKRVALKLIRRGMDSEEIVRRFHNERQILAHLDHPNVARLLDGGTTEDGLPYFAMDYVEGESIDKYCDARKLSTPERLELFRQVCAALHFAHQNLVVHRDLKPSNILVTADGVAKLLDFGIAKLLSPQPGAQTVKTEPGSRPMTIQYASPEQIRDQPITTASDVYSLGVLFYKLLTGRLPCHLDTCGRLQSMRVICEDEPARPSVAVRRREEIPAAGGTAELTPESVSRTRDGDPRKLRRRLADDVDSIALMAMRKEPLNRYGSVEQFSEDIRCHQEGLPVIARRSTFTYRVTKFARRHKPGLAAAPLGLRFHYLHDPPSETHYLGT